MKLFQTEEVFYSLVEELNKLVHEDVIITDETGIIVASTEKSRLNQFHEGAFQAIQEKKKMVMTYELSRSLKGVRKGVVLPMMIEGVPIGVLGITGNPKQVEPYALIVQKMSELFIKESIDQMTQEEAARNIEIFALDWMNGELDEHTLIEKGEFFNIDIRAYEQVISFYMPSMNNNVTYRELIRLKTLWDDQEVAVFLRWGQGRILIIDKGYETSALREKIKYFNKHIKNEFNQEGVFGVGQRGSYQEIVLSYNQAIRACKIAEIQNKMIFDEELRFEMIQYELNEHTKRRFIERTIEPIIKDKVLMKTLYSWLKNDMSIQGTSEDLYIHKNTLYYRIHKIENITNLNLRKIDNLALLYIATKFLEENRSSFNEHSTNVQ